MRERGGLQESTHSKTIRAKDRFHIIFLRKALLVYFRCLDEMMNQDFQHYSETITRFDDILRCVYQLERALVPAMVCGFERLLTKLRDSCHMMRMRDFRGIVGAFIELLGLEAGPKPQGFKCSTEEPFKFDVLSENKLNIVECVTRDQEFDMSSAIKTSESLARFIHCLNCVLDSRIPWNYLNYTCDLLKPFVTKFISIQDLSMISSEYLMHSSNLLSLILRTQKIGIPVDSHLCELHMTNFFHKQVGAPKHVLIRRHSMVYLTVLNLKKYYQVTAHLLMDSGRHPPIVSETMCKTIDGLLRDMFRVIFNQPLDIMRDSKYVDLFYALFDCLIEGLKVLKRLSSYEFKECSRRLKETNQYFTEGLDSEDKLGARGKVSEELLLLIWRAADLLEKPI